MTRGRRWRPTAATWIVGGIALLVGVIAIPGSGAGGFLVGVALFVLGGGIWTLVTGRPGWLNLPRTRGAGGGALGVAVAVLLLGAVVAPHPSGPSRGTVVDFAAVGSAPVAGPSGSGATSAATGTPTPTPTPTPSPKPSPKPVVTVTTVDVPEQIPFGHTSYDEPAQEVGTNVIVTPGVPGTKVTTWQVTLVDGVEKGRTLVSETVTVPPVDEVTAVGVGQPAPPPAPEAEPAPDAGGGCDPNYSGACVPIASDVDCAGGSGNGPAYVQGPVTVIGSDIYDLDRDGDGIACD